MECVPTSRVWWISWRSSPESRGRREINLHSYTAGSQSQTIHFLKDDLYHTIEIGKGYHMVSYEVANGPHLFTNINTKVC